VKHIILVRHATAVKRSPEKADFNRSLKKSGRKEAGEMAERLKAMKVRPKLFISSPANRAFETAEIFAEGLGRSTKKIKKYDELYDELSPEGFLELIRGLDDKNDAAIVFGHDPSFTDFARFLVPGFDGEMPKAGVLGVEADAAAWKDVKPDLARMAYFFHPGDTAAARPRRKDLRREIETRIEKAVSGVIDEFGIRSGKNLTQDIEKMSSKLAKRLASRVEKKKSAKAPSAAPTQGEEEQG
jgi:phosphohistidine phosphatase